jgi:hypothetical protein
LYGLSDYLAIIYQGIRLRNDNEIKWYKCKNARCERAVFRVLCLLKFRPRQWQTQEKKTLAEYADSSLYCIFVICLHITRSSYSDRLDTLFHCCGNCPSWRIMQQEDPNNLIVPDEACYRNDAPKHGGIRSWATNVLWTLENTWWTSTLWICFCSQLL